MLELISSKKGGLFPWKLYNLNRPETSGRADTEHFSSYQQLSVPEGHSITFSAESEHLFSYLFYGTTQFCTEGLQKSTGRELLTFSLSQPTHIAIPQRPLIRMIFFIFCGVEQWISLLFLPSTLHFLTASLFAEALKGWLAFRWQNIEKVRAVPHNAAMHGAQQLLKHHSHKSNAGTVCSGSLWKLFAWRSSRSDWARKIWTSF